MGRIKTKLLKRTGEELFNNNRDRFSENFQDNKKVILGLTELNSKKFKNVIAGYVTRLMKQKNRE